MSSGGPEERVADDAVYGERVRRLEAVVEASQMVNSSLDLEELAEHIVDIACRLIGAERGSLFLADPQSRSLRAMVAQGLPSGSLTVEFEQGIVGAVAASGEAEILDDPYADPRFDQRFDRATGYRTQSLLTVPIRNREGVLAAVLQLLNRRAGVFSTDDIEFLAELGVTFAIALTTARLHAETVARERRDPACVAARGSRTDPGPGTGGGHAALPRGGWRLLGRHSAGKRSLVAGRR
jgi:adenylate cyclase